MQVQHVLAVQQLLLPLWHIHDLQLVNLCLDVNLRFGQLLLEDLLSFFEFKNVLLGLIKLFDALCLSQPRCQKPLLDIDQLCCQVHLSLPRLQEALVGRKLLLTQLIVDVPNLAELLL